MKNKYILGLIPLLLISGCSGTPNEDKTYTVNYYLNNGDNTIYLTKDYSVSSFTLPKDPNIENKVFDGWYLESNCENKFSSAGFLLNSNLDLYAKWNEYSSLTELQKINKFQEALSTLSYHTSKIVETSTEVLAYPSQTEQTFTSYKYREYSRYKDILTYDYYSVDKNGNNKEKYAEYQYFYDDTNFYSIYHNLEDSSKNTISTSTFDNEKIESFLNIDYVTMFSGIEKYLKIYVADPNTYNSSKVEYEYTFNYTSLLASTVNYSYSEQYEYYKYVDSIGDYVTYFHGANYGILIENGRITSLNYQYGYYTALSEGVQEAIERTSIFDFYYDDDGYQEFNGDRFKTE